MGCLCSKNENTLELPKSQNNSSFLSPMKRTSSMINRDKLAKRFTSQVNLVKEFIMNLHKGLDQAENSKQVFCRSLENLDFCFTKKTTNFEVHDSQDFDCPSCLILYNAFDEVPLVLDCNHSICKSCAVVQYNDFNFVKCPVDFQITKKSPELLETNALMLETVELIDKGLFCFEHREKIDSYCFKCKKLICKGCLVDHSGHPAKPLEDEQVKFDILQWENSFESYIKKMNESKDTLLGHNSTLENMEEKLSKGIGNYIENIRNNRERVIEALESDSEYHILQMNHVLKRLLEILPKKHIDLYSDSIEHELESAQEKFVNFHELSVGEKLQIITEIDFKTQSLVTKPNLGPWEDIYKKVSSIKDYEALVLAMPSVQTQ